MSPVLQPANLSPWDPGMFGLVVFALMAITLIAVLILVSAWPGAKNMTPEKTRAYESGIIPTGNARLRYPVPFYLVAIFFLIFDVEGIYIFSWAIACKPLGWTGWLQISFFIFVLLLGLVYVWRNGGLAWGPKPSIK